MLYNIFFYLIIPHISRTFVTSKEIEDMLNQMVTDLTQSSFSVDIVSTAKIFTIMEHKFMNFEMAMLAMQAAQYIKAIEGYHLTSSIDVSIGRIDLTIFSEQPDVVCLPDGYLYSKRDFRSIGLVNDEEVFTTTYYFNF